MMWPVWCALIVLAGCLGMLVSWLWFAERLNEKDRLLAAAQDGMADLIAQTPRPNDVILNRARFLADLRGDCRTLTASETREVDEWVGLKP